MLLEVQVILLLGVAVGAIALAVAAVELRALRLLFQSGKLRIWVHTHYGDTETSSRAPGLFFSKAGFGVYIFRNGRWHLEADYSKPGYEAIAPTISGSFEDQVVKKESALRERG